MDGMKNLKKLVILLFYAQSNIPLKSIVYKILKKKNLLFQLDFLNMLIICILIWRSLFLKMTRMTYLIVNATLILIN